VGDRRLPGAQDRLASRRPITVPAAGVDLTLREWGDAAGRPLLFWHGLDPFGALALNEAGPAWAERGFRVLSFAAPGIADTTAFPDLGTYRPTRLADLIVEVAARLSLGRFAFVGWSWGASIGVHLGARHRERLDALVLLDAGHTDIPGDPEQTLDDLLAAAAERPERYRFPDWDAFLAAARETHPRWSPQLEERLRAAMHEVDGAVVARSDRRAAAAAWHGLIQEQPSSAHAALGRSDLPILLVTASRNDTAAEVERFHAAVPHAEVHRVESGHDLLAEAPTETIRLVPAWLDPGTTG
jgi:pimeloyl-ACP methyl ester carboxylesterase